MDSTVEKPAPYNNVEKPGEWSTGLCGCSANMCNCMMVFCCPCVTYGQVATLADGSDCCTSGALFTVAACFGVSCVLTFMQRQQLAKKEGIPTSFVDDCLASVCCGACVQCQMANHLDLQKDGCSFGAPAPRDETMQR